MKMKMQFVVITALLVGLFTSLEEANGKGSVSDESGSLPKVPLRMIPAPSPIKVLPPTNPPKAPAKDVIWSAREHVLVEGGSTNMIPYRVISVQQVCGVMCAVSYPMKEQKYPVIVEYLDDPRVLNNFKVQLVPSEVMRDMKMVSSIRMAYDLSEHPGEQFICFGGIYVGSLIYTGPSMFKIIPAPPRIIRQRQGLDE